MKKKYITYSILPYYPFISAALYNRLNLIAIISNMIEWKIGSYEEVVESVKRALI